MTIVKAAFNFWDVACPPSGACVAVGQSSRNQGMVVPVSHGVPGGGEMVPGTLGFGGAACPRANFCLAIGAGALATSVVVPITSGRPGRPVAVPGVYLYAIACGSPTSCWATGESTNLRRALVVHIVNAQIDRTYFLSGIGPGAFFGPSGNSPNAGTAFGPTPACTSATSCVLVGATRPFYGKPQGDGLIVTLADGNVRSRATVAGIAQFTGIACQSATTCVADGDPHGTVVTPGRLVSILNGRPTDVVPTEVGHTLALQLSGISCASDLRCYAVSRDGLIITIGRAKPLSVTTITATGSRAAAEIAGFDGVSCNTTTCVAAGGMYDPSVPERAVGAIYSF